MVDVCVEWEIDSLLSAGILTSALAIAGVPQAIAAPHCNPGKYAAWCAGATYDGPYDARGSAPPSEPNGASDRAGAATNDGFLLPTSKSKVSNPVSAHASSTAQASPALNGMSGRGLIEHEVRSRLGF